MPRLGRAGTVGRRRRSLSRRPGARHHRPAACRSVNDNRQAARPRRTPRTVRYGTRQERASMTTYRVGYFVGSLSSTSINRELSKALVRLAPEELEFTEIPIGTLP